MASELAAYYVSIVPSAKGLTKSIAKEFSGIDNEASKAGKSSGGAFGGAFKGALAGLGAVFAAAGIGSFIKDAVKGAGEIEQSFGALDSVFKGSSSQMKDWSRKAAKDVGLTSNEFNELGTLIGAQLKNGGTAMDQLAPKTKSLIGLGADLSSMFGGTTKDAVDALSSALKGERDPIEKYGVSLNQAKIDAEAAALGFEKVGGALSSEATQAATMSLIMKQTGDAHGNFAKESDTFAHKQQVMAAEWGNLTTKIGELFLPTITTVFAFISDKVIPVFTEGVGGVRAFGAAFKAADGDITSNGFPGFMERMAAGAIGLHDLLIKGDYRGLLYTAFGWEEDSPIVDFLLDLRDGVIETKDSLVDAGGWVVKNKDWLLTLAVTVGSVVVAYKTYTTALAVHAATIAIYTAVSAAAGTAQGFFAGAAFTAALGVTALNTALKANLFGIIALAVIGLVSGLVYFFTQTELGKDIVKNVFAFIQAVIGGVVDWFTNTALPAIQGFVGGFIGFFEDLGRGVDGAVQGVGGVFTWLHDTIIKPVFDGISAAITWVYESIIKPVFDGISAAVKFVGDVFTNWFNTSIKPVFDNAAVIINGFAMFFQGIGQVISSIVTFILIPLFMIFWARLSMAFKAIGTVISDWWDFAVGIFNGAVTFVRDTLGVAFTWLYESIIKPVFDAIGSAIDWVWVNVIKKTFDTWVFFFKNILGPAITWLHNNIVKPVFAGIGNAIKWVWDNVIRPTIDTWVYFFKNILGPAFKWLYETIIKPAFDGIGNAIKWVWENVIKPVFDFLAKAVTEEIPKAFDKGVAAVKRIWETIQDIAKAPIRFVINTVINDGLIGAFNTVAGFLPGIDKLPRVALPRGFHDGGYTGDGHEYAAAGVVHKGEYVFTKKQTEAIGKDRLSALADGAAVGSPMPGSMPFIGGIVQNAIRATRQLRLIPNGTYPMSDLMLAARAWNGRAGVTVTPSKDDGSMPTSRSNQVYVGYGGMPAASPWAIGYYSGRNITMRPNNPQQNETIIHEVGHALGIHHNEGNASIMHPMLRGGGAAWPTAYDTGNLRALYGPPGPGARPVADGGGGGGLTNPIDGIVDGLVKKFRETFKAGGFIADLAIGVGKKLVDSASGWIGGKLGLGQSGGASQSASLYDQGGVLPPGLSQVVNRTRKPEAILNPQQWVDIHSLAVGDGKSRGGFNNYGEIHVRDENELARIIMNKQRDAQAAYGF